MTKVFESTVMVKTVGKTASDPREEIKKYTVLSLTLEHSAYNGIGLNTPVKQKQKQNCSFEGRQIFTKKH